MSAFLEGVHRRPYAALAGLVFALYAQTLFFGLTLLDDNVYMVERLAFLRDWRNLPELFTRSSFLQSSGGFYYRPLLILSKMLDAQLGGGSFAVFHLSNIVFHAAACGLLFSVLCALAVPRARALALSALFAAHPVLVQAVAWMPGRTDTLLAVFVLGSLRAYLAFAARGGGGALALHLALLAAALLTKELAVVLPAACLLHALLLSKTPLPRRGGVLLALGWLASLGAWRLLRVAILDNPQGYTARAALNSVYNNLGALLPYLGKIVLPVGLSPYPILRDASPAPGLLALALLGAGLALSRAKDLRAWAWGFAWFFLFLLPSFVYPPASIVPVFFEYRAYLPMVGLVFVFAGLEWAWTPKDSSALLLLLLLSARTLSYSRVYADAIAFWGRAVELSPHSAFARKQLGTAYHIQGLPGPAIPQFLRALELNPREPMAHNNLGVVYMGLGRLREAQALFEAELKVNPGYDKALANIELVRERLGRAKDR